jgi:subtilase family serine protease
MRIHRIISILFMVGCTCVVQVSASYHFATFRGKPPIHVLGGVSKTPLGLTPEKMKSVYHLKDGGTGGVIAIIGAYDDASIEKDLATFSETFSLPLCTTKNGCFEKHTMAKKMTRNSNWELETTLDVEWAHAIAPRAKILLVEATSPSGKNLLDAIDYATGRNEVSVVSMSWGGSEFAEEVALDAHFKDKHGITFLASSGDNGYGVSWPAVSPYVIAVGGTSLSFDSQGSLAKETAWKGSGGGISAFEKAPQYQIEYAVTKAHGMRAVPDVAYNADPQSGFSIVRNGAWRIVGGTSAGAPQWAAIALLSGGITHDTLYKDKNSENNADYFRDIVSGNNGDCAYYCIARKRYDYVTGLGVPNTSAF